MYTWNAFSEAMPDLAKRGEELLFQHGVGLAFLATVRADGAPRLHPVCPVISNSRLFLLVLPHSPKRRDLLRDGRYALQTFPEPKPDSDEFYLVGKAALVTDPTLVADILKDAKHPASPDEIPFELFVVRAMHTIWEGFGTPNYRPIHRKWSAPPSPS
jgi:hypothetical protein